MEIYCYKLFLLTWRGVSGLSIESAEKRLLSPVRFYQALLLLVHSASVGDWKNTEEQYLGDRNLGILLV
jgi:hypothetical protein